MDLRDQTWSASEVTGYWPTGGREGLGRGMKVGREQIIGLLTAVREYLDAPGAWDQHYADEVAACEAALAACAQLHVHREHNEAMSVPTLVIDFANLPIDADEVARRLDQGTPRVHLSEAEAWRNRLILNPMALAPGDGARIGERIVTVVGAAPGGP